MSGRRGRFARPRFGQSHGWDDHWGGLEIGRLRTVGTAIADQPTLESLATHPAPDWFHDAKFGIVVHWTVSSIPVFAPPNKAGIGDVDLGTPSRWLRMFKNTPYAEWYWNAINIDGSSAQRHHRARYGADYAYDNFVPRFGTVRFWG